MDTKVHEAALKHVKEAIIDEIKKALEKTETKSAPVKDVWINRGYDEEDAYTEMVNRIFIDEKDGELVVESTFSVLLECGETDETYFADGYTFDEMLLIMNGIEL